MLHQVQGAYYTKNLASTASCRTRYALRLFRARAAYRLQRRARHHAAALSTRPRLVPPSQYRINTSRPTSCPTPFIGTISIRHGSSFVNRFGGDLMTTDDQWFRPVDCTLGPDGSLFFADWYDQRANHVDPKDDWDNQWPHLQARGRRHEQRSSGLNLATPPATNWWACSQIATIGTGREARVILAERRDPSILARLSAGAKQSGDARLALESLWTLYQCGGLESWRSSYSGIRPRMCGPGSCDCSAMINTFHPPWLHASWRSPAKSRVPSCEPIGLHGQATARPARFTARGGFLAHDEDVSDPHIPLLLWWAVEDKAATDREQVLTLFAT